MENPEAILPPATDHYGPNGSALALDAAFDLAAALAGGLTNRAATNDDATLARPATDAAQLAEAIHDITEHLAELAGVAR
jgi:hypothetical protein